MTIRFLVVQILLWGSACGERVAPRPTNPTLESELATLVRQAGEGFAATLKPDYQRPLLESSHDLEWVGERYLVACRAGDRRSCWLADAMTHGKGADEMVRRNCFVGDQMSCRALPAATFEDEAPDRTLLGWMGRALQCRDPLRCEEVIAQKCKLFDCRRFLRQECAAGFPASCWNAYVNPKDQRAHHRAVMLASEGCGAGLLAECRWLSHGSMDHDARSFGDKESCRLAADCRAFWAVDGDEARDALERACQYGFGGDQENACSDLEIGYRTHLYREPDPGRGRTVAQWVCEQLEGQAVCADEIRKKWGADTAPP